LIVTVNVIDDEGDPVLEVPVRVAVVVPEVVVLLELELLHPARMMSDANASAANETLHRRCRDTHPKPPTTTNSASAIRPPLRTRRASCSPWPGTDLLDVVVLTVNVVDAVVVVFDRVTEGALHVAAVGRFEQAKLIVPVNLFTAVTSTVIVPDAPGLDRVTAGFVEDT